MLNRLTFSTWFLLQAATAFASSPVATGDTSRPECVDALRLAKAMYESNAPRLYAPLKIPKEMQSRLILGAFDLDISGGNALDNSPEFEKLSRERGAIYWAAKASDGRRIVVEDIPMGWQGDTYDLYLLESSVSKAGFQNNGSANRPYQPVIAMAWRPPLVFQQDKQGTKWFIDVGHPADALNDWNVYTSKEGRPICTIAFHPGATNAADLLPKQVKALTKKLDEVLGPGHDEGTLQPTAGIRIAAQHLMSNAALRPWALSDGAAHNSRGEVDKGLEGWANANAARRRLYDEIQKAYPAAEQSLAAYYAGAYGLQAQKSQEVAKWTLDLMYRSYFVFPSEEARNRDRNARTNPWPLLTKP